MKPLQAALMALITIAFVIAVMSSPVQDVQRQEMGDSKQETNPTEPTAPKKRKPSRPLIETCSLIAEYYPEVPCNYARCMSQGTCEVIKRECLFRKNGHEKPLPLGILPIPECAGCRCWGHRLPTPEEKTTVDTVHSVKTEEM